METPDYDLISDDVEDQIFKASIDKIVSEQKDIDPEIQEAANKIIWDCL